MPRALITGVTGQDGSYLAEFLLAKGYEVHGLIRRSSTFPTSRIDHIFDDPHTEDARFTLHYGDMLDPVSLERLILELQPDELYHLAAQSHVRVSFDMPAYTIASITDGTTYLLEAVRHSGLPIRFYQAGSSEMFGNAPETPQRETTPFRPRSPYAAAKVAAHHMVSIYRDGYGLFGCNGILFNHESPRRGETFVTRKITRGLAHILAGRADALYLGNLEARRDWGFAGDYVEAMWMMLQQPQPDDYVVATGEAHSVSEFLHMACDLVGLDPERYVRVDPRYFRPTEVDLLLGDASKVRAALGWQPRVTFDALTRMMVEADLRLVGLDPAEYIRKAPAAGGRTS